MNYERLGNKIRTRRLELKMSQEKLSELCNISHQYLGQLERAERKPSLETVISLANNLNISVDYLVSDSLTSNTDLYTSKILALLTDKSDSAKQTAIDVLNALFIHID